MNDTLHADRQAAHFETLFAAGADPWHYRTRWYERRKREATLAALPDERYRNAFEPACAIGELSAALATRCDRLLSTDGSAAAVDRARQRVSAHPNVRVERAMLPADWPDGPFDLIVLSEFGYYLDADALQTVVDHTARTLTPGGTVVACHWRLPEGDYLQRGDDVHRTLDDRLTGHHGMARLARHEEADFLLDVWSSDARSVAQREGLRA